MRYRQKGACPIPYAILRFTKHQGGTARAIEAHHERQKDSYASNPNIDTARSHLNYHIVAPGGRYSSEIEQRITEAKCRTRKDSVRFIDTLITASKEFFQEKTPAETQAFFSCATGWLQGRVGAKNILSAVVHLDEETPHLHLIFTPITPDNRLCAKEILGNRKKLIEWQDSFHAHMVQQFPDLERGRSAAETGCKHIQPQLFKQSVYLGGQMEEIRKTLGNIGALNASKKSAEALEMLQKWFPQVEDFQTKLKRYESSLEELKTENATLNRAANDAIADKQDTTLELVGLRNQLQQYKQFYKKLPPEIQERMGKKQAMERKIRFTSSLSIA